MKALGIVRKIDELGRVVIPKEIRNTQGWEPGHPMEFFMEGNKLVIQSYAQERQRSEAVNKLEHILSDGLDHTNENQLQEVIDFLKGKSS